jgi:hypothetical protein
MLRKGSGFTLYLFLVCPEALEGLEKGCRCKCEAFANSVKNQS